MCQLDVTALRCGAQVHKPVLTPGIVRFSRSRYAKWLRQAILKGKYDLHSTQSVGEPSVYLSYLNQFRSYLLAGYLTNIFKRFQQYSVLQTIPTCLFFSVDSVHFHSFWIGHWQSRQFFDTYIYYLWNNNTTEINSCAIAGFNFTIWAKKFKIIRINARLQSCLYRTAKQHNVSQINNQSSTNMRPGRRLIWNSVHNIWFDGT